MTSLVLRRIRRWAKVHRLEGGGVWALMELRGAETNTKDGNSLLGMWAGCPMDNNKNIKSFNGLTSRICVYP